MSCSSRQDSRLCSRVKSCVFSLKRLCSREKQLIRVLVVSDAHSSKNHSKVRRKESRVKQAKRDEKAERGERERKRRKEREEEEEEEEAGEGETAIQEKTHKSSMLNLC